MSWPVAFGAAVAMVVAACSIGIALLYLIEEFVKLSDRRPNIALVAWGAVILLGLTVLIHSLAHHR